MSRIKKNMKKLIAIFCTIILIAPFIFSNPITISKAATDISDLKQITLKDFGLKNAAYGAGSQGKYTGGSNLDGTLFSVRLTPNTTATESRLYYGGAGGWSGLVVRISADGSAIYISDLESVLPNGNATMYFIYASDFGYTTWRGQDFLLQIATEYIGNDIHYRIYVDNVLCKMGADCNGETSWVATGAVSGGKIGTYLTIQNNGFSWMASEPEKEITLKDFGAANNTYNAGSIVGTYAGGDSLDGTMFSAKLTAQAGDQSILHYGATNADSYSGLTVRVLDDYIYISDLYGKVTGTIGTSHYIKASDFGYTTWKGNEFLLQIATDYVGNDIQFTIYVNGELCKTGHNGDGTASWVATNAVTKGGFGNLIRVQNNGFSWIESKNELKEITLKDFGMADKAYGVGSQGQYTGGSNLDGTLFSVRLTPNMTATESRLYYGGADGWSGLAVRISADGSAIYISDLGSVLPSGNATMYFIYASDFGYTTWRGQDFLLQIATEYVGNHIQYRVYVDNILCKMGQNNDGATTWVATGAVSGGKIGTYLTIQSNGFDLMESVREQKEITLKDFGAANNTYNAGSTVGTYAGGDSLDGTMFSAKLTAQAGDQSILYYGGNDLSSSSGLAIRVYDEYVYVSDLNGYLTGTIGTSHFIKASDFGYSSWKGNEFLLQIATDYVGNDIQFTIYVNGQLCKTGQNGDGTASWLATNAVTKGGFGNLIRVQNNGFSSITSNWGNITPEQLGYERVTPGDFNHPDGEYGYNSNPVAYSKGSLNNKYLDVDMKLPGTNGQSSFLNFAASSQYHGYLLYGAGDALAIWCYDNTNGAGGVVYYPKGMGITTVTDKFNVKFAVKHTMTKSSYTLWINDVLIAKDVTNNVKAGMIGNQFMTISNGPAITLGTPAVKTDVSEKQQSTVSYNLAQGDYLLVGQKVEVNGVAKTPGTTISEPGDYTIKRTVDYTEYTQTVSLYKIGDVDKNGVAGENADLEALETMLNNMLNEGAASCAAEYAADLDNDGNVWYKDLELMEKIVSGTQSLDSVLTQYHPAAMAYDYLGGDEVMPIAGFGGPAGNNVTDAVYQLVKGSGINMINSANDVVGGSGEQNALKAIQLAEKYGLGYYMTDYNLNLEYSQRTGAVSEGAEISNEKLAEYMSRYAYHENFLGFNVIDEPFNNNTYFDETTQKMKQLKYYDGFAKKLNSFANTIGYMTMYPTLGIPEDVFNETDNYYLKYIGAVKNDTNAKVLAHDHYPINGENSTTTDSWNTATFFTDLRDMRQKSIETKTPFWGTIQAGGDWRNDGSDAVTDSTKLPTEEETYWNTNMYLAFGAKGIAWFPLVQPAQYSNDSTQPSGHDYNRNGLIGADGITKTPFYTYATNMNRHIAAIDEVLMKSTSKGIMMATPTDLSYGTSTAKEIMVNTSNVPTISKTEKLQKVEYKAPGKRDAGAGAIIGCFDYRDTEAFYVVNYDVTKDATQTFTLTFDATHDYRVIQNANTSFGTGSTLTLTIPAGEGVLVVLEDRVVEYTSTEIEAYRSAEQMYAPDAEPGYIFAGWFSDETCKTPFGDNAKAGNSVWAKFVHQDVLTVQAQITASTENDSDEADIRFVATVDSEYYKEVGFFIEINDVKKRLKKPTTTVYKQLYAVGKETVDTLLPTLFSPMSLYFTAYSYWKVPNEHFDTEFIVQPYWITLDGTTVYGETAIKTVRMGIENK